MKAARTSSRGMSTHFIEGRRGDKVGGMGWVGGWAAGGVEDEEHKNQPEGLARPELREIRTPGPEDTQTHS